MKIPRLVVGGTQTGVGKTSVAIGLMGALRRKGLSVQGFKIGPDFLDTSFHTAVTGRPSRNLDSWMLPREKIPTVFAQGCQGADMAIIEGVMGVFDGVDGGSDRASTSEMSKILDAPVVLVIDVFGFAGSAAAVVVGYKSLDPEMRLAGVILNRVAGEAHAKMCREAIERHSDVPVLGAIPVDRAIALPERHLGLTPPTDLSDEKRLDHIIDLVERSVDLDRVETIAGSANVLSHTKGVEGKLKLQDQTVSIAVARDPAFSFYYQENLDELSRAGAELKFFSPIAGEKVPEGSDGIYIGGGYPEVYASDLSKNQQMRESIAKHGRDGMPIYAECGGFMYLTNSIRDLDGVEHRTVGLLDARTIMVKRLTLSYTLARTARSNILTSAGETVRGHEYHYSSATEVPADAQFAYEMEKGAGISNGRDGWTCYNTLASYMHTSFASDDRMAERLVNACVKYAKS